MSTEIYLVLSPVLGALEEHVLKEVSASVALLSLIAAARLDENTHAHTALESQSL